MAEQALHDRLRAAVMEQHPPMIRYFARRYANRGEPMEDLLQAGSIGLIKAVERFDPRRGPEFSTYAEPTILGEIRRHFRARLVAPVGTGQGSEDPPRARPPTSPASTTSGAWARRCSIRPGRRRGPARV